MLVYYWYIGSTELQGWNSRAPRAWEGVVSIGILLKYWYITGILLVYYCCIIAILLLYYCCIIGILFLYYWYLGSTELQGWNSRAPRAWEGVVNIGILLVYYYYIIGTLAH